MDATQICGYLDADLVTFIHNIIVVIKIAVPIILVIFGMLDLAKGVVAGKEDEIKKGQQVFIKRLIAAALVFFVITIVQLVMGLISSEDNSFWNCADHLIEVPFILCRRVHQTLFKNRTRHFILQMLKNHFCLTEIYHLVLLSNVHCKGYA